jgi:NTE family protein
MQRKLRELYARLPRENCTEKDEKDLLELGCASTLHIVRLPYGGHDWNMAAKDINFSKGSINWRWDQDTLTQCAPSKRAVAAACN